ncbi:unnamed protein product [Spirodela intermedia]|uniref:Uncharacterized protein n=1 Tax=Spirodela intermedia TaxID=51605 RepID=A0A7I8IUV5_SPIIN|nr:unnamed protein product [Spirodela intermedia]CAA6661412.1 unnamed protein product [Spirodela intermedia]
MGEEGVEKIVCPRSSQGLCAYHCLLNLKQEELIPKFRAEFKQLAAYLPCIPIEVLEDTYLKGLKLEIKSELTVYKPNGLGEIMDTLVQFEIHLQIV